MKCSNCGNEMTHSRNGWLCVSCGHVEADTSGGLGGAQIATGKEGHDQMRSASSDNASDAPVGTPATPVSNNPTDAPVADTAPASSPSVSDDATNTDAPAPAAAPPWAAPAEDSASTPSDDAKPADDTKSDDVPATIDISTAEPTGTASSDDDTTPPPTAADLSAVEQAVAQVAKVTGDEADKPEQETPDASTTTDTDSASEPDVPAVGSGSSDDAAAAGDDTKDAPDNQAPDKPDTDDPEPASSSESDDKPHDDDDKLKATDDADEDADDKAAPDDKDDDADAEATADKDANIASEASASDTKPDEAGESDDKDTDPPDRDETDKDEAEDEDPADKSAPASDTPESENAHEPEDAPKEPDTDSTKEPASEDTDTEAAAVDKETPPDDADDKPQADEPEPASSPVASDMHVRTHTATSLNGADTKDTDASADARKDDSGDDKPEDGKEAIDPENTPAESLEQVEHDEDAEHKADTNPADKAPSPEAQMPELDDASDDPLVKDDDDADAPATGSGPRPGPDAATSPGEPVPDVPPPIPDTPPDTSSTEPKAASEMSGPPGSPDSAHLPASAGQPDAGETPATSQDPAAPTAAQTTPAVPGAKPPLTPHTHPGPIGPLQIAAIIVVVVAAALLAYFFFMQPKTALGGYLEKVASSNSTTYTATLAQSSPTYRVALSGYGQTNFTDRTNPQASLSLQGQVNAQKAALSSTGQAAAGALTANVVMSGKTLYIEASTPKTLSELAGVTLTNNWYKYDMSGNQVGKCTAPENGSGSFFNSAVFSQIPVTGASFGGLKSFDGTSGWYYSGTIDDAGVTKAVAAVNKTLSSSCQLAISAADLRGVNIDFKLWRGWSKDQLQVNVTNSVTGMSSQLVIDTANYGKATAINVPPRPIDAQNIFHNVLGDATTGQAISPANASAESKARDAQREVILGNYLAWYKDAAPSGVYALAPPALVVQVNDPLTNNPYVVQTKAPTAVGQIWYHVGGSCTGAGITPGRTGSKYLSLVTTLESGEPFCIDTN